MRYFPLPGIEIEQKTLEKSLHEKYGWRKQDNSYADTDHHGTFNPIITDENGSYLVVGPHTGRITVEREASLDDLSLNSMHESAEAFLTYLQQSGVFQGSPDVRETHIPYAPRTRLEVIGNNIPENHARRIYKEAGDFASDQYRNYLPSDYPNRENKIMDPDVALSEHSSKRPDKHKLVFDISLPQNIWQQVWNESMK